MGLEAAFYGRVHSPPASWVLVLIPFAEELIHRSSLPVGPLPSEAEKGGGSAGPWASLICGHLETSSCTGIRLASIGEENGHGRKASRVAILEACARLEATHRGLECNISSQSLSL